MRPSSSHCQTRGTLCGAHPAPAQHLVVPASWPQQRPGETGSGEPCTNLPCRAHGSIGHWAPAGTLGVWATPPPGRVYLISVSAQFCALRPAVPVGCSALSDGRFRAGEPWGQLELSAEGGLRGYKRPSRTVIPPVPGCHSPRPKVSNREGSRLGGLLGEEGLLSQVLLGGAVLGQGVFRMGLLRELLLRLLELALLCAANAPALSSVPPPSGGLCVCTL